MFNYSLETIIVISIEFNLQYHNLPGGMDINKNTWKYVSKGKYIRNQIILTLSREKYGEQLIDFPLTLKI